jgi:hypothetical protein
VAFELKLLMQGKPLPPLPTPDISSGEPPTKRAEAKPAKTLSGDKLPEPEPVPS